MKKKSVLLTVSLLSVGVTLGAVALTNSFGELLLNAEGETPITHTVEFALTDFHVGQYDEDYTLYPISFIKEDAITDSQGNKYDVASDDFYGLTYSGSYFSCFGTGYTFGGDQFISFTSNPPEAFSLQFTLLSRADLDFDKSIVSYTVDGAYNNIKIGDNYVNNPDGTTSYTFYKYFSNVKGKEIKITNVKLVFSCIQ